MPDLVIRNLHASIDGAEIGTLVPGHDGTGDHSLEIVLNGSATVVEPGVKLEPVR